MTKKLNEILYLLSMVAYNMKSIASVEPEDLYKAGCQCQKELAEILYDTVRQIEFGKQHL